MMLINSALPPHPGKDKQVHPSAQFSLPTTFVASQISSSVQESQGGCKAGKQLKTYLRDHVL